MCVIGGCAPLFALALDNELGEGGGEEPPLEEASQASTCFPSLRRCHLLQVCGWRVAGGEWRVYISLFCHIHRPLIGLL